jgi:SAM-dependent methyltransferase
MAADLDPAPDQTPAALEPSPWVARFAPMVPEGGTVLDVACGSGRHARMFRDRGHPVVVLDRDVVRVSDMAVDPDVEIVARDLENGRPWPLEGRTFAGVVVVNYLHRPLFPALVRSVAPGGVLIYETFAVGNERFGKPSNPNFLLHREELLIAVRPAARQRVVAVRVG